MTRCAHCNGAVIDRDYDYGLTCLNCSRPLVRPEPPSWLLQETELSLARQGQYFAGIVACEAKAIRAAADAGRRTWA